MTARRTASALARPQKGMNLTQDSPTLTKFEFIGDPNLNRLVTARVVEPHRGAADEQHGVEAYVVP